MKLAIKCTALLSLLSIGFSCKKADHPFVSCAIQQMKSYRYPYNNPDTSTIKFYYTSWGAPERVVTSKPATGNPQVKFQYDQNKRLTHYIEYFSEEHPYMITNYVYGSNNLITSDTTRFVALNKIVAVVNYFYDSQHRIIRTSTTYPDLGTFSQEYTYDGRGNLQLPYPGIYDNKVSLRRTNPVWMFIDRDYSMNNRLPVNNNYTINYNREGLPTFYTSSNDDDGINNGPKLLFHSANEVTYDCKLKYDKLKEKDYRHLAPAGFGK